MSFVSGQTVTAPGIPEQMTVQTVLGGLVICSFMRAGIGPQSVGYPPYDLALVTPQAPVGLNPGPVTIPLGAPHIEGLLGFELLWPRQCVVAGAGVVPYTFTPGGPIAPGNTYIELVANGISAAPTVSGMSAAAQNSYTNIAGCVNGLSIQSDGYDVFYSWGVPVNGLIPTPVGFTAALNGTVLTGTFGGNTLGPVTPPLSAFTLVAARSGQPAPYFLSSINPISSGDTQVVLNITNGTFQAGDVVQLSYAPPAGNPLQDTSKLNKVALWLNAAVTVQ